MPEEMPGPKRPDEIERLLGNTHRCQDCGHTFNQTRNGPNKCRVCASRNIKPLKGLILIDNDYSPLID